MKTWIINSASIDDDELGQPRLCVGVTTAEWIRASGDEETPGNATTFVWVVLWENQLIEIGFRPHAAVTENECLAQVPVLLRFVRQYLEVARLTGEALDPALLLGANLTPATT
jgi:hypothetical protein